MRSDRPRALVARLDGAGDVLLAGPAVRAVAAGSRSLTFLCGPSGVEAAHLLPGVDQVRVFDAPWVALEPGPFSAGPVDDLLAWLRADPPDVAVVLTSFHQSPLPLALLCKLAGVGTVIAAPEDHPGSLVDVRRRPEWDGDDHEVERSLRLVEMAGFPLPDGDDGRLAIRGHGAGHGHDGHGGAPEGPVVVHPGASVPARGIDAGTAAAAVRLLAAAGHDVVVTGGPDEVGLARRVAAAGGSRAIAVAGRASLAELAALVASASVVVSGNTGPGHLAAAVGTPVVSVFAATVPARRWRPWGVPLRLLGDESVPCAGCRARTCPVAGQPCLAPATPEAIVAAVEDLVAATAGPGRQHAAPTDVPRNPSPVLASPVAAAAALAVAAPAAAVEGAR
ncbi:MAG: glycosyltransferase family 9 protein [Actinobacteria bacterium]|nr:glycosyltransferase family 9 protein [Actinomycetota bacterium]